VAASVIDDESCVKYVVDALLQLHVTTPASKSAPEKMQPSDV
jgi:hypothetical protein